MLKYIRYQILALKVKRDDGSISDVFEEWGLSVSLATHDIGQKKEHIRKPNGHNGTAQSKERCVGWGYTNEGQVLWTFP